MKQSAWCPTAAMETLNLRAHMLSRIRSFFSQRGILEVETPLLSRAGSTDPNMQSFHVTTATGRHYLQTSPEFAMKRLLASGCGDIYQICKAFRRDELGHYHNPEFSLLEWYRTGFDHLRLMKEVEAMLRNLLIRRTTLKESLRLSFASACNRYANLDPGCASKTDFAEAVRAHGMDVPAGLSANECLDLLFARVIAPALPRDRLTFIIDFPASQASLAKIRPGNPSVAERFEVFYGPLELANGFHELTDPVEQRNRFEREREQRIHMGLEDVPVDERLVSALEHGLPECAGVALGLDRLLMLMAKEERIDAVLAFPWRRA